MILERDGDLDLDLYASMNLRMSGGWNAWWSPGRNVNLCVSRSPVKSEFSPLWCDGAKARGCLGPKGTGLQGFQGVGVQVCGCVSSLSENLKRIFLCLLIKINVTFLKKLYIYLKKTIEI